MLVGTRKGLFILRGQGERWQPDTHAFLGDPVSLTLHDPRDGALYAALNLGHFGCKLHRSEDGGRTWQEIGVPLNPAKTSQAGPEQAGPEADPNPWSLQLIWSLEAGAASQPGRLLCGTIPGGLFRSDNRGDSWQLVDSLWQRPERRGWWGGGYDQPGVHSICIDPRDANTLTLGVSIGSIWRSTDDGTSWTQHGHGLRAEYTPAEHAAELNQQDPHRVLQCTAAPEVFWTQHHNGIFVSRDGADTWREIHGVQPSSFGFALAVHPQRPDTAWFAPAQSNACRVPVDGRFVVTRSDDGGASFQVQRNGPPGGVAWDLVYRHALVVATDGETLAMGSTSGSLWATANGGNRWQHVDAYLPSIACVRIITE